LFVDGHDYLAGAVGAGRYELGVAWETARVAPHRPASGFVAEDGKAGRVLARPNWLGVTAFEDPALFGAGSLGEEVAADVAADEVVEVGGRGYDASGCEEPAGGDQLAYVLLGKFGGVVVVAVDVGLLQVRSSREGGFLMPSGSYTCSWS
jgi:hypothetical protein